MEPLGALMISVFESNCWQVFEFFIGDAGNRPLKQIGVRNGLECRIVDRKLSKAPAELGRLGEPSSRFLAVGAHAISASNMVGNRNLFRDGQPTSCSKARSTQHQSCYPRDRLSRIRIGFGRRRQTAASVGGQSGSGNTNSHLMK